MAIPLMSNAGLIPLEPSPDQFGVPHGRERFLARSKAPDHSPYHFQVTLGAECHGLYGKERSPASLLIIHTQFNSNSNARPIEKATIKLTFSNFEGKPDQAAPSIVRFALGWKNELRIERTIETRKKTTTREATGGVSGGTVVQGNAGFKWTEENEVSKKIDFSTTLKGYRIPSSDGLDDPPNMMTWISEGNPSQETGVAPNMTLAILLTREADALCCQAEVTVDISKTIGQVIASWVGNFKKWGVKLPLSKIDPASPIAPVEEVKDADHLEEFDNETGGMASMCIVRMPETYFYDGKEKPGSQESERPEEGLVDDGKQLGKAAA
ncbi:hypothetical protein BKA61DRAFT_625869 [Leptodontidium sp. MPI-SDFR-AT-0119]|nr:hypothetical protein BKA61DRAFT_625869 [Leptodontidium sp. MPI-SDFR-AT-0119]